MYEVNIKPPAERFLRKLDKFFQKRLINKISELKINPFIGKPLVGNLSGFWRLRVDKYRILYKVEKQKLIVYVLDIGHRKNIY